MRDTERLRKLKEKERIYTGRLHNAISMDAVERLETQIQNLKLLISKETKNKRI
tara:strand:- start:838 stop:999 length:162 start_codon:yes stop_codon:yes gene_type:complete